MKNKKDMIKWLNNLKSDIGQPQHSQLWHYAEILDVIARYLESTDLKPERPKGHGRLIDADKLLQELFTVDEEEWTTPEIRTILENAPTIITPTERPKGEWKPKNHHTDYCSNCGFEETQWRTADYNFCPNCGADMCL